MVIDDDEVVRMTLTLLLEKAGHEVVAADDGRKGMALFKMNPADVVLTDIYMPNQEGLATIMALRRAYPGVKVVAISGGGAHAGLDVLPVAEALGADRALRKPVSPKELAAVIKELIEELTAPGEK